MAALRAGRLARRLRQHVALGSVVGSKPPTPTALAQQVLGSTLERTDVQVEFVPLLPKTSTGSDAPANGIIRQPGAYTGLACEAREDTSGRCSSSPRSRQANTSRPRPKITAYRPISHTRASAPAPG
jgi:hypothetical protein